MLLRAWPWVLNLRALRALRALVQDDDRFFFRIPNSESPIPPSACGGAA